MTDTDPTLALIPELHAVARTHGQKIWSRRSVSITAVVLVHAIVLFILFIGLIAPVSPPDKIIPMPIETVLLLNTGRKNAVSEPEQKKEIPRPSAAQRSNAITLPPPTPPRTQQEENLDVMGGVGRALACEAGQYEYLAPSARAKCDQVFVPWKLDRKALAAAEQRRLQPVDPNKAALILNGADSNRRTNETSGSPCLGLTAAAAEGCQTLHPAGTPVR